MKKILILILTLLFIRTNIYAQGDLIVEGKIGIGTDTPGASLDVRGSAVFNEDGGDNDFRIEGITESNLFFVDASNDVIGIGTNSPYTDSVLNLKHTGDKFSPFRVDINNTATTATNSYGALLTTTFNGSLSSTGNHQKVGTSYTLRVGANADYNLTTGRLIAFDALLDGRPTKSNYFYDVAVFKIGHEWANSTAPYFSAENYGGLIVGDIAERGTWGLDTITNAFGIKVNKQTYGTNRMGIWLNGDGYGADIVLGSNQETRLYGSQSNFIIDTIGNIGVGTTAPTEKLEVAGRVKAQEFITGDITFQKDGEKLWRMFEDEDGLYIENLKTGKVYRFVLQEVK
jgi:hypothetical protein